MARHILKKLHLILQQVWPLWRLGLLTYLQKLKATDALIESQWQILRFCSTALTSYFGSLFAKYKDKKHYGNTSVSHALAEEEGRSSSFNSLPPRIAVSMQHSPFWQCLIIVCVVLCTFLAISSNLFITDDCCFLFIVLAISQLSCGARYYFNN